MYIINNNTLYLKYDGVNTIIKTSDGDICFSGDAIEEILNYNCITNGSSFKGRKNASKVILKSKYKLPIIISEREKIIFFPIFVDNLKYWFNFKCIHDIKRVDRCVLLDFGSFSFVLNTKFSLFNNMLLKCSRLWVLFFS